jgi:hypothetical protein
MTDHDKFHWFVSSAFHWRTGYNLRLILAEISKADRAVYKDKKKYKDHEKGVSIWRVPGEETIKYSINYFNPQVEGALYCGSVDITDGLMHCDSEDDRTMHLEEKKRG